MASLQNKMSNNNYSQANTTVEQQLAFLQNTANDKKASNTFDARTV